MDTNYLVIILIVLVVAAALLFVWMRRDRALPPVDTEILPREPDAMFPAEGLADPLIAVPTAPAAEPEPLPEPATAGPPDNLTTLKGLGPKAAAQLNALGITRFDQLAALSGDELARVDGQMGALQGRIARDRWVEQAGHLAAGDVAGFEAKFGKLGG